MSFIARCQIPRREHCTDFIEEHTTPQSARAAAVWHVYTEHPDTWMQVIGDRPPVDARPRTGKYAP